MLAHKALAQARSLLPGVLVTGAVRETLAEVRRGITGGDMALPSIDELAVSSAERAFLAIMPSLRAVINATGVIIHTNLGRAPLSQSALDAIQQAASYSNLEYDLTEGERGSRYVHAVQILRRVVGCEDALVVNNNAAALVLVLTCLCAGREAILSRGQSVEIGGGFRIPEVMKTSGARLVEVGTTNRTYARDYSEAISAETAIVMRVHASNFRIVGFTTQPSVQDLAELAHEHDILLVDDIGSGALLDTSRYGLRAEPTPQESLTAGADLVLFSGDKLLGGPQCGVIVGRADLIAKLRKHPLTRAFRVDKLTLAALEATLLHYLKGEAEREVPVWRMLSIPSEELRATAESWADALREADITCEITSGESAVGGGALPGETLPTHLLSIPLTEARAGEMAQALRDRPIPIIARVEHGALLLDPRTVLPQKHQILVDTLKKILAE